MRRLWSRDGLLLIVLLVLVAGFTAFVANRQREMQEQQQVNTAFSSQSPLPNGTLALYQWLGRMGYNVTRIQDQKFEIAPDTRVLFLFSPIVDVESEEAEYILQWVERGNTLVLADSRFLGNNPLFRQLDAEPTSLDDRVLQTELSQPLVDAPMASVQVETFQGLDMQGTNFVTYAASDGKPLLVRVPYGKGAVWLSTAPQIFTNENLNNESNAKLAAALVSQVPRGSQIAFDEYHLGFVPEETGLFFSVLYDAPWGWGVLFTLVLVFAYLALNGRRLGKAMPVPQTLARRSPSEYVTSMANLFRRANKRGMVLQHYRHSLKRRLGRPYHLNPDLSDEHFVEMMMRLRPELDRHELVDILNGLRRTDTSEGDLVKTVDEAVTFGTRGKN